MSSLFYRVIDERHGPGCACYLLVNWIPEDFIGNGDNTGYIVQHFRRQLSQDSTLEIPEYCSTEYFEAWYIENGIIVDAHSDDTCNDQFSIGNPMMLSDQFPLSINTKGHFTFRGELYWVPKDCSLFSTVDVWDRTTVKQANGLKSSFSCPEIENQLKPVCIRRDFEHSWDLSDEEKIYSEAKEHLFRCCPQNTPRDLELLQSRVEWWLEEKYPHLANRLVDEWKQQWN